ncbi:MAG: PAS domain-containing protein [Candidatus Thorarchaeota archaeon]|jgi:PAS domain S-box-containing protein
MNRSQNSKEGINRDILQLLFDSSPQGVIVIHEGKVLYSNTALASAIGFEPGQAIGMDINELAMVLGPKNSESVLQRYRVLISGKVKSDKDRFHTTGPEGHKLVLELIALYSELNGKKYVILYATDVTNDVLSKETLTAERKAYSVVMEAALSTTDVPELCSQILDGLVETLGFDLGTIRLYDPISDTLNLIASYGIDEGGTAEVVQLDDPDYLVARTARTKSPLFTEDIDKSPESKDRMARARELGVHALIFWPVIGSEDNLLGVINIAARGSKPLEEEQRTVFATIAGMFSTILERRRTEQELQEFKDRFTAFADNMPGPVYIKDDASRVLFINRYMREAAPKPSQDDWEGTSTIDHFQKDRAEVINEEDQKVLKEGPIDRVQETTRNGKPVTFRTHKFPIIREGKSPLIGGFSIDITEQVKAEKQREEARARAIWMSDLMAHDINNLHQGIMSSLELILEDDEFPEHLRNIAQSAIKQVNRSVSLINNVKKFSMVNQEELVLQKTDPADALTAAIQTVKQSFPNRKISISTNLESGTYCIMSNEFLQDVFYNLLHNAVKFTLSDEVSIDVTTSLVDDGEFLRFDFDDRGQGIADRLKESILTGIEDRVHRVSGVGLTLVRQIINQYAGTIWIENRVKGDFTKGTRFVVKLPNGC